MQKKGRRWAMLEKYVPDFDSDAFLQELAAEKRVTKKEALEICRKAIPKEAYYQKKVIDGLKKQFPDAYIAKIAQGMYSQGGIPDVMFIMRGHYFGFEIKRPVFGKISKLQEVTMARIRRSGGTAAVVSWPEEAEGIIESWRCYSHGNGQG